MDPADEWMQAELESRRKPEAAPTNMIDDDDDDDPFRDLADDDLLRALPCAHDDGPPPSSFAGVNAPVGSLGQSLTDHRTTATVSAAAPINQLDGDILAETHQSGFFSASLLGDEDWAAYIQADQDDAVSSLRVPETNRIHASMDDRTRPSTQSTATDAPTGVFTSAIPSERPSFVLRGDDGRRLWVTASGMEKKMPHRDQVNGQTVLSSSSAYLDDEDDEDDDYERSGRSTERTAHTAGALPSSASQSAAAPSLLGEVSIQELLQEARTSLAEETAARRAARAEAEQRAANARSADEALLAAALDDDDEEDAVGQRVSREAYLRRAKKRLRSSDDAGSETDAPSHKAHEKRSKAGEDMLWVAKYTPRNFREVLSDESINLELLRWLKSWDPLVFEPEPGKGGAATRAEGPGSRSAPQPPDERIAILVGPPGVGKTTLAHVLAAHCGYEAIEINASVERTAARLEGTIQLAVSPGGGARRRRPRTAAAASPDGVDDAGLEKAASLADILLRPKCLIIDEMDGIASNVAQFLLRQDIQRPVFCLCNDFYVPSLRLMRQRCRHVFHLPPIQPQRLLGRLEEVCARERLHVEQAALAELVHGSHGDIRSCLNTLQFLKGLPAIHPGQLPTSDTTSATAKPHRGGTATVDMVRAVQGKDNKLDVWESWSLVFVKNDRNRILQLLKKDCGVDYEALVMASTANHQAAVALRRQRERERVVGASLRTTATMTSTPTPSPHTHAVVPVGFRVDPGYLLASHELPRCADLPLLLDGLQENYCQRPYTDYTLQRTAAAAEGFSRQDVLSTAAFVRAPVLFGFAEDFQLVTALTCYTSCSTATRGPRLQYPRLQSQLHRRVAESEQVALALREGCYSVDVVSHLWSDESLSTDLSVLLLRCLVDASVRLPSHPINAIAVLPPMERARMEASVARHAAYGLGYRESTSGSGGGAAGGGGAWDPETRERRPEWRLVPELDLLGGIRKPFSAPAAADGRGGFQGSYQTRGHLSDDGRGTSSGYASTPFARRPSSASPAPGNTTLACRALTLREETKQLLQGEIHRYIVQRTAASHAAHQEALGRRSALRKRPAREDDALKEASAATASEPQSGAGQEAASVGADSPATKSAKFEVVPSQTPSAREATEHTHTTIRLGADAYGQAMTAATGGGGVVKRDFFGRPIAPKKALSTPSSPSAGGTAASSTKNHDDDKARGTSVPIKYIYHDGCTNAVKMPATFADF